MLFSFYAFRRAADVNASGEVDIMDATYIRRWLANIDTPYPIGDQLSEPTQPTEPVLLMKIENRYFTFSAIDVNQAPPGTWF